MQLCSVCLVISTEDRRVEICPPNREKTVESLCCRSIWEEVRAVSTGRPKMGKFSRGAVLLTSCMFAAITGKFRKFVTYFCAFSWKSKPMVSFRVAVTAC